MFVSCFKNSCSDSRPRLPGRVKLGGTFILGHERVCRRNQAICPKYTRVL